MNVRTDRAVVIGAGLGGLSAAIHLRRAGLQVTVFESNAQAGGRAGRIEQQGYRFDTGPSLLNYPWVFRELFAAAGADFDRRVRLQRVDPALHFVWPDGGAFTLCGELDRLREEVERVSPGDSIGLMEFLADAEVKYNLAFRKLVTSDRERLLFWFAALSPREMLRTAVWRSLDAELGRFFRSPRLREAFGAYAMYLGGSPAELAGLFSILPYGELAYGLWLPAGGMYALIQAVETLARELGVRIVTGRRVSRIRTKGRCVEGVELADGEVEAAGCVVSNVDVPTTWGELLGRPARRRLRMTPGVITFYWGVRGGVPGMPHHTIFLPTTSGRAYAELMAGRLPAELPFYVSVPSRTDDSLAPPGADAVFVLVPCPCISQHHDSWGATVERVRRQVETRLAQHGWAISKAAREVDVVWTPLDWRDRYGLFDGSAFGAAHTRAQIGPLRPPNRDVEVHGLYYVGASTRPGTGLPMVALSGAMTARRVFSDAH
ncbi:MAG: phytoene desaturase family protein [Kiritimatiellae bacterium]|nr:phytoene desaturase family protein [Kiritimatiellia bacterium]